MNGISDFLDYFNLTDLLFVSDNVTVAQFLGLTIVAFISSIFVIVMFRCVMEFIKIITDYRRFK